MRHEKIFCFDCSREVTAHLDWEPFMHRCYCGDFEHVRLCSICIDELSKNGSTLQYAFYENALTPLSSVFDDVDSDITIHDCAHGNCAHEDEEFTCQT